MIAMAWTGLGGVAVLPVERNPHQLRQKREETGVFGKGPSPTACLASDLHMPPWARIDEGFSEVAHPPRWNRWMDDLKSAGHHAP